MCGRFALYHSAAQLSERFSIERIVVDLPPRYNVAPTQPVAVVVQPSQRHLEAFKWGLVPFWAKDPKIGNRMINARAETLAEKPAYRAALKRRRCLIPASGFFEWKKAEKEKIPHYIHLADDRPFAMAGLWEEWTSPADELLHTCTIITTQANDFMTPIHHRMPVILSSAAQETWLDPSLEDPSELVSLLQPYPDDDLTAHPVSKQVNKPVYDAPDCIEPASIS